MKIRYEFDKFSWTIGVAICRSRKTKKLCYLITFFCLGFLIMPRDY